MIDASVTYEKLRDLAEEVAPQLSERSTREIAHYLDHNELDLTWEEMWFSLSEEGIAVTADRLERLRQIGYDMELDVREMESENPISITPPDTPPRASEFGSNRLG